MSSTDGLAPTTHRMKRVYVCSPLRGIVDGLSETKRKAQFNFYRCQAAKICKTLARTGKIIPIAPHVYCPAFLDDDVPEERAIGLQMGQELLLVCDELWICNNIISAGMAAEIQTALSMGMPVMQIKGDKPVPVRFASLPQAGDAMERITTT